MVHLLLQRDWGELVCKHLQGFPRSKGQSCTKKGPLPRKPGIKEKTLWGRNWALGRG